ncbi:uncharacterized protein [Prorops nasuta]|uniref:uncharacterized protein n=1 Tax=Prorops nasuta TaxID=863751 RepID=UPI0034CE89B7
MNRILNIGACSSSERSINNSLEALRNEPVKKIKLPVAQLPKFSGDIEQWLSYKNTFVTMIDSREDITDLQKFLYLKKSVKGDALNKIAIYDASDASYKLAWNLLIETYEKKRILISKHLDAIIDIPAQIRSTSMELTQAVDSLKQHTSVLAILGIKIDEHILIRLIERSFPLNIRSRWEETLSLNEFPSLKNLYNFVAETAFKLNIMENDKNRKRSANNIEQNHSYKIRRNGDARVMVTSTYKQSCVLCQKDRHAIYRCPLYNEMTIAQRWEKIKRLGVCKNCLRNHHNPCASIKCRICNYFHHTSLHRDKAREESHHMNKKNKIECSSAEKANQENNNN